MIRYYRSVTGDNSASHPAATVAIPGMTRVRHIDDNFAAAQAPMPDARQRRQMELFFDAL